MYLLLKKQDDNEEPLCDLFYPQKGIRKIVVNFIYLFQAMSF